MGAATSHPHPSADPNRRYWDQFRPPGRPPSTRPWRLLGLCLLVATLGGAAHALVYRWGTQGWGGHTFGRQGHPGVEGHKGGGTQR